MHADNLREFKESLLTDMLHDNGGANSPYLDLARLDRWKVGSHGTCAAPTCAAVYAGSCRANGCLECELHALTPQFEVQGFGIKSEGSIEKPLLSAFFWYLVHANRPRNEYGSRGSNLDMDESPPDPCMQVTGSCPASRPLTDAGHRLTTEH
jgi:hypothetical protein